MSDYIASYEMPQENVEWLRGVGLSDDWRTTAVQVSDEMVEKAVVGCQKVCTDFQIDFSDFYMTALLDNRKRLAKKIRVDISYT